MRCAPSASRADRTSMNPGEALRRSRLDDHKGVFTGLPKGGGYATRPSDWHFGQGIGRDDQIGRHIIRYFSEVGSQDPCPLQGQVFTLGGKAAGQLQELLVVVQKCDSRNAGIDGNCRPGGGAGSRARIKQGPGRKLRAPPGEFRQAEANGRIGGWQARHQIGAQIQGPARAPALPVVFRHAGRFPHQRSRTGFQ